MPRPNSGPRLKLRKQKGAQPVWEIVWYEQGRRRTQSTGSGIRHEADKALALHILRQNPSPDQRDPANRRIADVLTLYAHEHAPHAADPERIGYAIKALLPFWGGKVVDDINEQSCRDYCQSRGVAEGTTRRELVTLQAAINYDFKHRRLTSTVPVWMPPNPPGKERWLTRTEAAKLLRAARSMRRSRDYLPLYILVSLYTGARKEAVLELTWDRVFLEQGYIQFDVDGQQRTKKRRARPPIPRPLKTFLRLARRRNKKYVIEHNGDRLDNMKKSFRNACELAGLQDVTPHTLRHTATTWLVQAGVPLWEVSGYVGLTVQTIERVYGHHAPDRLENARKAME